MHPILVGADVCGPQPVSRPRPQAAPGGLGLDAGEDRDMLAGDEEGGSRSVHGHHRLVGRDVMVAWPCPRAPRLILVRERRGRSAT